MKINFPLTQEQKDNAMSLLASYFDMTPEELSKKINKIYVNAENYYIPACTDGDYNFDPKNAKCGWCGKLNLQFDDVGFFYKDKGKEYLPFCEKCGVPCTAER